MDSAIRQIMALDADIEKRMQSAERIARQKLQDARENAAAIEQASGRKIQDAVIDMEAAMREEFDQKSAEVRREADSRAVALQQDFSGRREELLETLFRDVLERAGGVS